jgi:hypothetical protein
MGTFYVPFYGTSVGYITFAAIYWVSENWGLTPRFFAIRNMWWTTLVTSSVRGSQVSDKATSKKTSWEVEGGFHSFSNGFVFREHIQTRKLFGGCWKVFGGPDQELIIQRFLSSDESKVRWFHDPVVSCSGLRDDKVVWNQENLFLRLMEVSQLQFLHDKLATSWQVRSTKAQTWSVPMATSRFLGLDLHVSSCSKLPRCSKGVCRRRDDEGVGKGGHVTGKSSRRWIFLYINMRGS